jgi:hypothetical protein
MCFLGATNWVFIFKKTAFFIVTAVETSNLIYLRKVCTIHGVVSCRCEYVIEVNSHV